MSHEAPKKPTVELKFIAIGEIDEDVIVEAGSKDPVLCYRVTGTNLEAQQAFCAVLVRFLAKDPKEIIEALNRAGVRK